MSDAIIQKRLLSSRNYTLEYNGVRVLEKGLNKQFSYFVPFEEVPSTPFSLRMYDKTAIILTVVCSVAAVIIAIGFIQSGQITIGNIVFVLALVGIPAALTWYTRKELAGLGVPGNGLILRANQPSAQAVQAFLQALKQAKISYLREAYFDKSVADSPARELQVLLWLKEHGAISDGEFETQRQNLSESKPASTIGVQPKK
ncbi:MAG TPA: hypothetical protein VFU22_03750 [Roseiflexaceae bacterium]|nr:hypothetical protein [Roseiflexaceae bacterium]